MNIKEALIKTRQLLCFESAIRYGSISKAAEKSFMKQSNLSVQIKELEDETGEHLINRIHNGVKLTEAGKEVYALACDLYNVINKSTSINTKAFHMSGGIKLWTSDGLGAGYISECLPEFCMAYPNVNIEICCSLEMPMQDQFDMAVIYEEPKDSGLKVVGKYDLKFGLFASKAYLAKWGYPKNLKDLQENHRICTKENYLSVWPKWREFIQGSHYVSARTNSSSMLLQLVKDGIGVGLLPIGTATKEEGLMHISRININLHHKFWIVIREEIQNIDKVKLLVDYINNASQKL